MRDPDFGGRSVKCARTSRLVAGISGGSYPRLLARPGTRRHNPSGAIFKRYSDGYWTAHAGKKQHLDPGFEFRSVRNSGVIAVPKSDWPGLGTIE